MRVLLVEDDLYLARIIAKGLGDRGHPVTHVGTGADAVHQGKTGRFEVCILDWELPDRTGIDVLRDLRADGGRFPVVMLTGRSLLDDKVTGLRAGADDYLVKPFEFEELVARLEAVTRRGTGDGPVRVGPAVVDPRRRTVTVGDHVEKLTERESALMLELARHAGEPLTRAHLLETVWRGEPVNLNVVDVYVGYLRAKLERLGRPGVEITAVRKVGFRLDDRE